MAQDRRGLLKSFTVLSRLWPLSSFTRVSLQVQGLFATFWSHLQTKDRQSQTLHLHWTRKEIKVEQALWCVPSPNFACSPDTPTGSSSFSRAGTVPPRVPWALQQACLLCTDTRLQHWQAAASSLHLTSGCPHWLWMKDQGCIEQIRGPSLFPIHGTAPKCLHLTVVPHSQEGPGDPSSAQMSWAESPAHHAQKSQIHNV